MSKFENEIIPLRENQSEKVELWEEEFKNPEKIEVYGGEMKVIDLKPEKLKSEVPTMLLRGWGTNADVFKTNLKEIASDNRRAITVNEPYGIDVENIPDEKRREHDIPEVELRKVAALLKTIEEKELDKVDLVTHSEGSIYGIYAALLRPDKFRNMVLVDPAGMVGESSQSKLLKGAALDIALQTGRILKNLLKEGGVDAFKKSLVGGRVSGQVFAGSPKHVTESIGVIAQSQIHELLGILRELGIKISIIHGVDDNFFPMEDVQKQVSTKSADGFYSVKGTHNQLYLHPEQYTKLVNQALDALETLRDKETEIAGDATK
jgi:pimeloyl-ACP methyl ester carboxylesterase